MNKLFLIVVLHFSDGHIDALMLDTTAAPHGCGYYEELIKKHISKDKLIYVECRKGNKNVTKIK